MVRALKAAMISAEVVEKSVTTTVSSSSQDYSHLMPFKVVSK